MSPEIQTEFRYSDPLPPVMADEHQISIAFRNLIRNARDAMPAGGTLSFDAEVGDETVMVSVMDTGVGIPPGDLAKIMEPLFTTKARGMGLGLSITCAIVEKNLGTLSVESEHGVGTRFQVTLQIGK
jgi:two-component system sensor kinase FixL